MLTMIAFASQDLGLAPSQWKAVARKAMAAGKTIPEYLRLLIEADLLAGKTFDEILRPVRRNFRKSGTTEAQLDRVVSRARRLASSRGGSAETKHVPSMSESSGRPRVVFTAIYWFKPSRLIVGRRPVACAWLSQGTLSYLSAGPRSASFAAYSHMTRCWQSAQT